MNQNFLFMSLMLVTVACNSTKEDTSALGECEVAEDCTMQISVWDPTCDGDSDVLLTPTGSGLNDCVEGQCVMDFELVETDCSETGQVCQNDESNIGSCVDPAE